MSGHPSPVPPIQQSTRLRPIVRILLLFTLTQLSAHYRFRITAIFFTFHPPTAVFRVCHDNNNIILYHLTICDACACFPIVMFFVLPFGAGTETQNSFVAVGEEQVSSPPRIRQLVLNVPAGQCDWTFIE